MNAELIGAAIFVTGVIFAAGKFANSVTEGTRKELAQAKLDINRLGSKLRDGEKAAARRHLNLCAVIIAAQENKEDRFRIAGLLKED